MFAFRRKARESNERGAVLVEMAFMLPVLVLLIFGAMEFGLMFKERLTIASAANSAGRTGATMGTDLEADIAILEALEAGLYDQVDIGVVSWVDIFQANETTGAMISGKSNRYSYQPAASCKWVPCPDPSHTDYVTPSPWPPADRDTVLEPLDGLDVLGVEITYRHTAVTNILPGLTRNFTERALIRLEPDLFGGTP